MKPSHLRMVAVSLGGYLAMTAIFGGCEGGTSSETVGMVEETAGPDKITGRTDPGNTLGLYSADFQPHVNSGFAMTITADSNGNFTFPNLSPGRYHLLARRPSDGKAALVADIAVPAEAIATGRARLEATGSVSGTITATVPAYLGIAYAPGTPFFVPADSQMHYLLTGMPAGAYKIVKTWQTMSCAPGAVCVGPVRQDSAIVRIRPGENAAW